MSADMSLSFAAGASVDAFAAQDELLKVIESTMGNISSLLEKRVKEQMSFSALKSLIVSVIKLTLSTAGVADPEMEEKVMKEIMEQGLLPKPTERKGALSGYTLFTKEKHAEFKENDGYKGKKPIELTKEIGAMWKALSEEEKAKYNKRAVEFNAENPSVASRKGSKKSTKSRKGEPKHTCSFVMTKGERLGQPCGASVRSDEPTHEGEWLCSKHATAEKKKAERAESKKSEKKKSKKTEKKEEEEEEKPKKKTKKTEKKKDEEEEEEEEKPKKAKKSKKTEKKDEEEEEEEKPKKKAKKTEKKAEDEEEEENPKKKAKKTEKKAEEEEEEEKPKKKAKKTEKKEEEEEEKPKKEEKKEVKKLSPEDAKVKAQAILDELMDEYEIIGKSLKGSMSKDNLEKYLKMNIESDNESFEVTVLYPPTSLLFTVTVDEEEVEKRVLINDKAPTSLKNLHAYLKML